MSLVSVIGRSLRFSIVQIRCEPGTPWSMAIETVRAGEVKFRQKPVMNVRVCAIADISQRSCVPRIADLVPLFSPCRAQLPGVVRVSRALPCPGGGRPTAQAAHGYGAG